MLAISSERLSISSRIAWVTALVSPLGSGAFAAALEARGSTGPSRGAGWAMTEAGDADNGDDEEYCYGSIS